MLDEEMAMPKTTTRQAAHLPTLTAGGWAMTRLLDSLVEVLSSDKVGTEFELYMYAVTSSGWDEIAPIIEKWRKRKPSRIVRAFVGTDHGITDADALTEMLDDGVELYLLTEYVGTYHPKVCLLRAPGKLTVWIGSNNLTRDGLRNNIEFAAIVESSHSNADFDKWIKEVAACSMPATKDQINNYRAERDEFAGQRAVAATFVWSQRKRRSRKVNKARKKLFVLPKSGKQSKQTFRSRSFPIPKGNMILEIMPRETGAGGKQIQMPIEVLSGFFGMVGTPGESQVVHVREHGTDRYKPLTLTVFGNHTARLVLSALDYRDRPCVVVFRHQSKGRFEYQIVSQGIFPDYYDDLLERCGPPTREGSRRWTIVR